MSRWDDKILAAADKISKGIEKGADYISNLNTSKAENKVQIPQSSNEGERKVKHCPSCGHTVSSIDLFCPACGSSLEDAKASSAAQTLANNLMIIDSQKEGIIRNFIRTKQDKISEKATQKAQMIKSFPVPNTKKDLLEFIHMAASNINTKIMLGQTDNSSLDLDAIKSEQLLSGAWLEKMEAIYQKARTLLSGDTDFIKIENIYNAKKNEIETLKKEIEKKKKRNNIVAAVIMLIFVLGLVVGTIFGIRGERQAKIEKNEHLEALVMEIRQDIAEGNYNEALLKTNKVRLKDGDSSEEEDKWDRQREALIREIEKAQGTTDR